MLEDFRANVLKRQNNTFSLHRLLYLNARNRLIFFRVTVDREQA